MQELEKKLNYTFRDSTLLEEALSHSSYANEHRSARLRSNERLEFLGDSVLGFVTAEFLFLQHPDLPEGDLTRIRAALVCEQSLYEVARKLNLGAYLRLGRGEESGGGRTRTSILADATEAVFAAAEAALSRQHVRVLGLMTIPPAAADRETNMRYFQEVHTLYVDIDENLFHNELKYLSMGMSGDYADAVRAGATMVRVGSAIFGAREYSL